MKNFHNVYIRTMVKEYEGDRLEEGRQLIEQLCPFDLKEQKLVIAQDTNLRHDNITPIYILSLKIEKQKLVESFLDALLEKLGKAAVQDILAHLYVDEQCFFYVRLDKNELKEGKYVLTTSGDCMHIRILIASYPVNAIKGAGIAKDYLEQKLASMH